MFYHGHLGVVNPYDHVQVQRRRGMVLHEVGIKTLFAFLTGEKALGTRLLFNNRDGQNITV